MGLRVQKVLSHRTGCSFLARAIISMATIFEIQTESRRVQNLRNSRLASVPEVQKALNSLVYSILLLR